MKTLKCGACEYARKLDAMNGGTLGKETLGCHGLPPTPYPVPGPGGQIGILVMVPTVEAERPACSLFEGRAPALVS